MANDNKIEMELLLNDGSIKKQFKKVTEEGSDSAEKLSDIFKKTDIGKAFVSASIAVTGLNQGLELAKKGFNALKNAADSFIEKIKEGERVNIINQQFQILANRAGAAASILQNDFIKAAGGLADSTEVIEVANRAMVELGESASRLPELLLLAKQATKVFGGELVSNFEALNLAIASGNTRSLRQIGIIVDSAKSYKQYADSIGVAVDRLTQNEKQQALFNAVLEKGRANFEGLQSTAAKNTIEFKKLSVVLSELSETISVKTSDAFGDLFGGASNSISKFIDRVNTDLKAGSGQIGASIDSIKEKIEFLERTIKSPGISFAGRVDEFKKELIGLNKELARLNDIQKAAEDDARKAAGRLAQANPIEARFSTAELQANAAAFQQALSLAQDQNLQLRIQAAQKITDENQKNAALDSLDKVRAEQLERDHQTRLLKIREDFSNKKGFSDAEVRALEEQENINFQLKQESLQVESEERKLKRIKEIQAQVKTLLVNGISNTLQAVGAALQKGENAFDAFKNGVIGIIGDLMIQLGTAIIAQAIAIDALAKTIATGTAGFGIAAGAALIVAGGAIKASVGGGTGLSYGGEISGGPAAGDIPSTATNVSEEQLTSQQQQVVVNIQGNVLDRRQTGLEIVEVLQEAFDTQGARIITA